LTLSHAAYSQWAGSTTAEDPVIIPARLLRRIEPDESAATGRAAVPIPPMESWGGGGRWHAIGEVDRP
jgi:hypothetical protein